MKKKRKEEIVLFIGVGILIAMAFAAIYYFNYITTGSGLYDY